MKHKYTSFWTSLHFWIRSWLDNETYKVSIPSLKLNCDANCYRFHILSIFSCVLLLEIFLRLYSQHNLGIAMKVDINQYLGYWPVSYTWLNNHTMSEMLSLSMCFKISEGILSSPVWFLSFSVWIVYSISDWISSNINT